MSRLDGDRRVDVKILVTALRGFIEQHGSDFSANMPGKLQMVFQWCSHRGANDHWEI